MSIESILAFTAAFFLLAVSPGPGLAAILSRSLGTGLRAGFVVTAGLVLGDALFLGIAIVGLSAIASALGPVFQIVKYAGAVYLVWLGVKALRTCATPVRVSAQASSTLAESFGLGLLVTLGNPKPILFYSALLPTFLDLQKTSAQDFAVLMAIVITVSFLVYGAYMLLVEQSRRLLASTQAAKRLNQATGVMLIGSGVVVASR